MYISADFGYKEQRFRLYNIYAGFFFVLINFKKS